MECYNNRKLQNLPRILSIGEGRLLVREFFYLLGAGSCRARFFAMGPDQPQVQAAGPAKEFFHLMGRDGGRNFDQTLPILYLEFL